MAALDQLVDRCPGGHRSGVRVIDREAVGVVGRVARLFHRDAVFLQRLRLLLSAFGLEASVVRTHVEFWAGLIVAVQCGSRSCESA